MVMAVRIQKSMSLFLRQERTGRYRRNCGVTNVMGGESLSKVFSRRNKRTRTPRKERTKACHNRIHRVIAGMQCR